MGAEGGLSQRLMRAIDRGWIIAFLVMIALLAVLATFRDYGSNWDEAIQAEYGELSLRYFRSGFTDTRCNDFDDTIRFYGPLVEMLPALVSGGPAEAGNHPRPGRGPAYWERRHLVMALFGVASLAAVAWFARLDGLPGLGVLAVLALATMPRFYGDWFANSKDVPFAFAFTVTMGALVAAFRAPRFTWRHVLACGAASGFTMCVRPGGFPFLAFFFLVAGALSARRPAVPRIRELAVAGLGTFTLAWVLMVLPWPWAHANPVANPIEAMRIAASDAWSYPVLFEGKVVESSAVPRHYLVKYLAITTPPLLMALCLVGLVTGLVTSRRDRSASFPFLMTVAWFALPLALFAIVRPNVYDGIRHFLFTLPAVALLAARGAAWIVSRPALPARRAAAFAGIALALLLPVKELRAMHPYETAYFNRFAGGVKGASGHYDTEYWLTSYREAIEWVNGRAAAHPERTTVMVVIADGLIKPWVHAYAGPGVRPLVIRTPPADPVLPEGMDYYVASRRWDMDRGYALAPVVHSVGRQGAVFTVVKGSGSVR